MQEQNPPSTESQLSSTAFILQSRHDEPQPYQGKRQKVVNISNCASGETHVPLEVGFGGDVVWLEGRPFIMVEDSMYLLPTDQGEMERLCGIHNVLGWAFESNYCAPILRDTMVNSNVLDIGCGDGTWIFDMIKEFPYSNFFGVDICIYPPPINQPQNVHFQVVNILDGLPFEDEIFDFVHMRMMMYAFKTDEWPKVMNEIYRVCKKGAWIELSEEDLCQYRAGPASERLVYLASHALIARDIDPFIARHLDHILHQAQFVNIEKSYFSIPCGKWDKKIGELFEEDTLSLYRAFKPWMAKTMNMSLQEFEELLLAMAAEFSSYGTYLNWYVAYGRKPYVMKDGRGWPTRAKLNFMPATTANSDGDNNDLSGCGSSKRAENGIGNERIRTAPESSVSGRE